MPKLFYIPQGILEKTHAKPLARDVWFKAHQSLLLQMLRTNYGRDLLCVDKALPLIDQISHRHISCQIEEFTRWSEFRVGAKYGNGIRYRWQEFLEYAEYLVDRELDRSRAIAKLYGVPLIAGGSVTTLSPDPSVESTTVDGYAERDTNTGETWTTTRDGAGTSANDSGTEALEHLFLGGTRRLFRRRAILFDSSSIPDDDTIDSAILSLWYTEVTDDYAGGATALVSVSLASNTAVASGDYAIANWGTTRFSTDEDYTGITTGQYTAITLNSDGLANISKTGITDIGTRNALDVDDGDPAADGDSKTKLSSADETGTTQDPKLAVTHTTPVTDSFVASGFYGGKGLARTPSRRWF
jgi:hypothetical protein